MQTNVLVIRLSLLVDPFYAGERRDERKREGGGGERGDNTVNLRDQMEEWSAAEANLFEDAVEKYGKDFNDVRNDFVSYLLFD